MTSRRGVAGYRGRMDEATAKPTSHLTRLSRYLLAGGIGSLAVATLLQWSQYNGGRVMGQWRDSVVLLLASQLLMVLGTAALTGAAFAYVMLALRRDRLDSSTTVEDADEFE